MALRQVVCHRSHPYHLNSLSPAEHSGFVCAVSWSNLWYMLLSERSEWLIGGQSQNYAWQCANELGCIHDYGTVLSQWSVYVRFANKNTAYQTYSPYSNHIKGNHHNYHEIFRYRFLPSAFVPHSQILKASCTPPCLVTLLTLTIAWASCCLPDPVLSRSFACVFTNHHSVQGILLEV